MQKDTKGVVHIKLQHTQCISGTGRLTKEIGKVSCRIALPFQIRIFNNRPLAIHHFHTVLLQVIGISLHFGQYLIHRYGARHIPIGESHHISDVRSHNRSWSQYLTNNGSHSYFQRIVSVIAGLHLGYIHQNVFRLMIEREIPSVVHRQLNGSVFYTIRYRNRIAQEISQHLISAVFTFQSFYHLHYRFGGFHV